MRTLSTLSLLFVVASVPLAGAAQWGVTAEIGVARFGGTSRDSSGTQVGPYRPTTFELRLDRALGPTRVAIAAQYARTGIAGEGGGLAFVQYDIASFWEIAPQISWRLARFGAGVDVRLEGGPAFTLWDINGESRNRVGGRAAAAFEWPLAGGLRGSLRMGGVLSPSIFDAADTPAGVERRATRRFSVALGLRYEL
ncbi:MAG TPA: hypothetical protein VJN39_04845 [Gemmatimonadales bacterium]|nr:hypothetical protein [Gemmatimonadales bacterium]